MLAPLELPPSYQADIQRAAHLLKTAGCSQVFLFGSLATGQTSAASDIDLAVRGCPRGRFFALYGQLMLELNHPIDLVNLDRPEAFARFLIQHGELQEIV